MWVCGVETNLWVLCLILNHLFSWKFLRVMALTSLGTGDSLCYAHSDTFYLVAVVSRNLYFINLFIVHTHGEN